MTQSNSPSSLSASLHPRRSRYSNHISTRNAPMTSSQHSCLHIHHRCLSRLPPYRRVPLTAPRSDRQHASLARHSMIINGIWRNACALGICNDNLWDAIVASWGWSSVLWAICSASIDRVGDVFAFVYDLMLMSYDTLHIIMNSQHHPYLSAHSKFTASSYFIS
jgi:hypothetical protein